MEINFVFRLSSSSNRYYLYPTHIHQLRFFIVCLCMCVIFEMSILIAHTLRDIYSLFEINLKREKKRNALTTIARLQCDQTRGFKIIKLYQEHFCELEKISKFFRIIFLVFLVNYIRIFFFNVNLKRNLAINLTKFQIVLKFVKK